MLSSLGRHLIRRHRPRIYHSLIFRSKSEINVLFCRLIVAISVKIHASPILRIIPKVPCEKCASLDSLPLRRPHELDLEAAAVGGLAVAAAGIMEVEDDFPQRTLIIDFSDSTVASKRLAIAPLSFFVPYQSEYSILTFPLAIELRLVEYSEKVI